MIQSSGLSADVTEGPARGFTVRLTALRKSRAAAALRVYEQECALDDARGSGVAVWISRAEQALHSAIVDYEAVSAAA